MSKHAVRGDYGLPDFWSALRNFEESAGENGEGLPRRHPGEAGLDDPNDRAGGIESHVVDPASITT